ncbi:M10 family metallopeptidase C-terminal domain-containing protein [Pseudoruegeria sp. SHC-113]|uniref:M10 family metallopeptidase C-terminal domain-containing protein n=1 Tax=Pseudoruegeria sp. SHC-113 TaxID=2855439 RepID=UPI0021BB2981|nr:M10 family metallopeptidase C-terminal domain-containing protein [Pseudoruegeria sp. SHC-113]MCT8161137.1 M10 family metallopeptidase C-terminal domain-containing protein [Pseudoruegeria sp. SHC-113]
MTLLPSDIQTVSTVFDDPTLEFLVAADVELVTIGGRTFLYVASIVDDGIAVFELTSNGTLLPLPDVEDDGTVELDGAFQLTSLEIGGSTYLLASGQFDDGLSLFSVDPSTGALSHVDSISDTPALELDGASGLTSVTIGSRTFVVVAGYNDSGISVLEIGQNLHFSHVQSIPDSGNLELQNAYFSHATTVGGKVLVFVTGYLDDGISVFEMDPAGGLTPRFDLADSAATLLGRPAEMASVDIDGTTYLYVASQAEAGVSIFSVSPDGTLTPSGQVSDPAMAGAHGLSTHDIGGTTLLAVASQTAGTVSVFAVQSNGGLSLVGRLSDDGNTAFAGTLHGAFTEIEGRLFYVASGASDSGVSVLEIGGGDATLEGTEGDDQILGLGGDDHLIGQAGDDTLNGGAGDDTMVGGAGADVLDGGDGTDTAVYEGSEDVIVSLVDGTGSSGDAEGDTLSGIENLVGGDGDDDLIGNASDNQLDGGAGRDALRGNEGGDVLSGDDGNDVLDGGAGADVLDGGADRDTLDGGTGDDILTGGAGRDWFVFRAEFGSDTVTDFEHQTDRIDLRAYPDLVRWQQLSFEQVGDDVLMTIHGTADSILFLDQTAEDFGRSDFLL